MDYTNNLAFLDFEASSLAENSWPIEIGVSWLSDEGEIESHSRLIRRHPTWDAAAWSKKSEHLHGISMDQLEREGIEAGEAAWWFVSVTRGRRIGSDAPEFEARWLRSLLATAVDDGGVSEQVARVVDFYNLVSPMLRGPALDTFFERLARQRAPHRAGPDSARFAKALKAAFDKR